MLPICVAVRFADCATMEKGGAEAPLKPLVFCGRFVHEERAVSATACGFAGGLSGALRACRYFCRWSKCWLGAW